jgi:membrane protein implicated in regulation of membrane protease activity
MGWINQIEFWHWMAFGLLLAAVETVVPGAFFLWLGIAAIVTGFVKLVIPGMGWEGQFSVFAVFAVVSTILWLVWWRRRPIDTDKPELNLRGEQMVGRVVTLDEALVNGEGSAKFGDTVWRVRGAEYVKGTRVKVVGAEGTVLLVEKA